MSGNTAPHRGASTEYQSSSISLGALHCTRNRNESLAALALTHRTYRLIIIIMAGPGRSTINDPTTPSPRQCHGAAFCYVCLMPSPVRHRPSNRVRVTGALEVFGSFLFLIFPRLAGSFILLRSLKQTSRSFVRSFAPFFIAPLSLSFSLCPLLMLRRNFVRLFPFPISIVTICRRIASCCIVRYTTFNSGPSSAC